MAKEWLENSLCHLHSEFHKLFIIIFLRYIHNFIRVGRTNSVIVPSLGWRRNGMVGEFLVPSSFSVWSSISFCIIFLRYIHNLSTTSSNS